MALALFLIFCEMSFGPLDQVTLKQNLGHRTTEMLLSEGELAELFACVLLCYKQCNLCRK